MSIFGLRKIDYASCSFFIIAVITIIIIVVILIVIVIVVLVIVVIVMIIIIVIVHVVLIFMYFTTFYSLCFFLFFLSQSVEVPEHSAILAQSFITMRKFREIPTNAHQILCERR